MMMATHTVAAMEAEAALVNTEVRGRRDVPRDQAPVAMAVGRKVPTRPQVRWWAAAEQHGHHR